MGTQQVNQLFILKVSGDYTMCSFRLLVSSFLIFSSYSVGKKNKNTKTTHNMTGKHANEQLILQKCPPECVKRVVWWKYWLKITLNVELGLILMFTLGESHQPFQYRELFYASRTSNIEAEVSASIVESLKRKKNSTTHPLSINFLYFYERNINTHFSVKKWDQIKSCKIVTEFMMGCECWEAHRIFSLFI